MPLTLEQYAAYLDTRKDLSWPPPPVVEAPKVRPAIVHLPGLRAVLWNVYGTLINIWGGDLLFECFHIIFSGQKLYFGSNTLVPEIFLALKDIAGKIQLRLQLLEVLLQDGIIHFEQ